MFIAFGFVESAWEGQLQKSYKFYKKKTQT